MRLITSIILKEHQFILTDFHCSNVLNASNKAKSIKNLIRVHQKQYHEQNLIPPSTKAKPAQVKSYESRVENIMSTYMDIGPDNVNDYILDSILDPHARYKDEQENE